MQDMRNDPLILLIGTAGLFIFSGRGRDDYLTPKLSAAFWTEMGAFGYNGVAFGAAQMLRPVQVK